MDECRCFAAIEVWLGMKGPGVVREAGPLGCRLASELLLKQQANTAASKHGAYLG